MTNILVIDDDPAFRSLLTEILSGAGYDVIAANSIESGIEFVNRGDMVPLQAALVDFWLEGKSAVPLLDQLHRQFPRLPLIMISGGGGHISLEITRAIGEVSGVVHFLPKPFRRAELLDLLEQFT